MNKSGFSPYPLCSPKRSKRIPPTNAIIMIRIQIHYHFLPQSVECVCRWNRFRSCFVINLFNHRDDDMHRVLFERTPSYSNTARPTIPQRLCYIALEPIGPYRRSWDSHQLSALSECIEGHEVRRPLAQGAH